MAATTFAPAVVRAAGAPGTRASSSQRRARSHSSFSPPEKISSGRDWPNASVKAAAVIVFAVSAASSSA
jgi:hypothetical protein